MGLQIQGVDFNVNSEENISEEAQSGHHQHPFSDWYDLLSKFVLTFFHKIKNFPY